MNITGKTSGETEMVDEEGNKECLKGHVNGSTKESRKRTLTGL